MVAFKQIVLFVIFVCTVALVTVPTQSASLYDGGESAYDDGEMVEIPYRIVKKWTDFKKRAHPRRVLLPRFE
uniref:Uncharacterized protein n=1 Tax=Mesocestoides corti TaxID=53468 RepID=A0A5K3FCT8_MESCO